MDATIALIDIPRDVLSAAMTAYPEALHLSSPIGRADNCAKCGADCCVHRDIRLYLYKEQDSSTIAAKVVQHFECTGSNCAGHAAGGDSDVTMTTEDDTATEVPRSADNDEPKSEDAESSLEPSHVLCQTQLLGFDTFEIASATEDFKLGDHCCGATEDTIDESAFEAEFLAELLRRMTPPTARARPGQRMARARRNRNRAERHRAKLEQIQEEFDFGDLFFNFIENPQYGGRRFWLDEECKYCKSNRETIEFQRTHTLYTNGVVSCPILRKFVCPLCNATGDFAHTVKYCPFHPTAAAFSYRTTRNAHGRTRQLKH